MVEETWDNGFFATSSAFLTNRPLAIAEHKTLWNIATNFWTLRIPTSESTAYYYNATWILLVWEFLDSLCTLYIELCATL